jgi:hypothetical protein
MLEQALPAVNKLPNRSHTVTIVFLTFEVTETGDFIFALMLDGQIYERTISIELRDAPRPAD